MTDMPIPGEIRRILKEANIDATAASWPHPGFVIAGGCTVAPCMLRGVLFVNGAPMYSAAWL